LDFIYSGIKSCNYQCIIGQITIFLYIYFGGRKKDKKTGRFSCPAGKWFYETAAISLVLFYAAVYDIPVNYVPEGLDEFRPLILIIEIIGVFPDIQDQEYIKRRINELVVLLYLHNYRPLQH
jgi:hypothetical protein